MICIQHLIFFKANMRPYFLFQGKHVFAAGVILSRLINGRIELLLQEKKGGFQDLGGKVDECDATVLDTITREASEETNGLLDKEDLKSRLSIEEKYYYYIPHSKYLFTVLIATEKEAALEAEAFGSKEEGQGHERRILWVPIAELSSENLFCRLHAPQFLRELMIIQTYFQSV
jgi:8-oxo-dGTP pyrophosphatase MutT (NUDIX family)